MRKVFLTIVPLLFTAQACNFLFGELGGEQGSGSRGVFMSTDGGQTWEERNTIGKDKDLAGAQISRIIFAPSDPKSLLAVSFNSGVFATNTGGEQWFSLLPSFAGYDAFINPQKPAEVFVAGSREQVATILKTGDSGSTWVQIYAEPVGRAAVVALAYDPRNPLVFYAGLSTGTILKTLDAGNTWNTLVNFSDRLMKILLSDDGQEIYVLSRAQGLRRSPDGGKSWTSLKIPETPGQYNDFVLQTGNAATAYLATDKGLFKTQDGGTTWVKLLLPATPQVNNVSAVAINPQNSRQVFAAIRSTVYRSDDSGASWRTQSLATNRVMSQIVVNPAEPNRIYAGLR